MADRKSMSRRGEEAAAAYLERVGIRVIERTWECSAGIIDIVGWDEDVLVLVDVKTCRSNSGVIGHPSSRAYERRMRRIAQAYLEYAGLDVAVRFDRIVLLVIAGDRALLRHHRNVLDAVS